MGTTALAAAWTGLKAVAGQAGAPNLRVGIISDPHVTGYNNAQWMEKAFRLFASRNVDAVLITGDIGTSSYEQDWQAVSKAWYNVFPNDKRADGARVERLFLTGNHDIDDWYYHGDHAAKRLAIKDRAENRAFSFHRQELWKKYWGEDYEPMFVKTVKGYTFILRNWLSVLGLKPEDYAVAGGGRTLYENHKSPIPEALARALPRIEGTGRPFFYCQHDQMKDTVNATHLVAGRPWGNGEDNGYARSFIEKYPQCVVLTGHSHNSLTDEQSIWQGRFTAVNCSCARGYAFSRPGRENGFSCPDFRRNPPFEMAKFDHGAVRQGLVMDVFDDRIVFERLDLTYDQSLGEDWVVPLFAGGATVPPTGVPKYDFASRKAAAKAPQFAPGDKVKVETVKDGHRRTADGMGALDQAETHAQVRVSFPPITRKTSPSRGFDFRVTCEARIADAVRVVDERFVFSPNFAQAESRDVVPCACNFPAAEMPTRGEVRFVVTPYDCWNNAGAPLASEWKSM